MIKKINSLPIKYINNLNITIVCILCILCSFALEYIIGLHPCIMCKVERWSYIFPTIIGLMIHFVNRSKKKVNPHNQVLKTLQLLNIVVFTAMFCITVFHILVEFEIVSLSACSMEIDDIIAQITSQNIHPCSIPSYFLGMRLTYINLIITAFLLISGVYEFRKKTT